MLNKTTYLRQVLLLIGFLCLRLAYADVQIGGLSDFNFGTIYPPYAENYTQTSQACIYNSDADSYRITVNGLHDKNSNFFMTNNVSTIRYQVEWDQGGNDYKVLNAGQVYNFSGAVNKVNCTGIPSSLWPQLRLTILGSWFVPTPTAGNYRDELSIFLEPI